MERGPSGIFLVEETRQDPDHSPLTVTSLENEHQRIVSSKSGTNHDNMSHPPHRDTGDNNDNNNIWSSIERHTNNPSKIRSSSQGNKSGSGIDSSFHSTETVASGVTNATTSSPPWYNSNSNSNIPVPGGAPGGTHNQYPHRNSSLALAAVTANNPQGFQYANSGQTPSGIIRDNIRPSHHQQSSDRMCEVAASMDQLHLSSKPVSGVHATMSASVGSTTSQSIPEMVGASSGSTLGGVSGASTSVGGQQQQFHHRQQQQQHQYSGISPADRYPWAVGGGFGQQQPPYHQRMSAGPYPVQHAQHHLQQQQFGSSLSVAAAATASSSALGEDFQFSAPPPGFSGYGRRQQQQETFATTHSSKTQSRKWTPGTESLYSQGSSGYTTDRETINPYAMHSTSVYRSSSVPVVSKGASTRQRRDKRGDRGLSEPYHGDYNQYSSQKYDRSSGSSLQESFPVHDSTVDQGYRNESNVRGDDQTYQSSQASSEAIRMLMYRSESSLTSSTGSTLVASRLSLDKLVDETSRGQGTGDRIGDSLASIGGGTSVGRPILPAMEEMVFDFSPYGSGEEDEEEDDYSHLWGTDSSGGVGSSAIGSTQSKKREWLLRMNRRLTDIPVGDLDPSVTPINAIMNAWAKTKSAHGASMVEQWLNRAQQEYDNGNIRVVVTNKMYTMAVDAWAKSGEGVSAAQRAEAILQHMNQQYQATGLENLKPTTGIFNAVINAWARSKDKIAPSRAEQILKWMNNLHRTNPSIRPDKYTYNTVIHAYAKSGGAVAAKKAQELLENMQKMYQQGNPSTKPDTITYNVVINSLAKSGGKDAAEEAEVLLNKMHQISSAGNRDVRPNVVTYGAVIDAYAKSGEKGAAAKADSLLAKMIHLYQLDPVANADLRPNTYVFNTVINAHAKSKEHDAASKAEEMLLAMNRLNQQGMPNLKPDAFTYTAVIDAWAKSGYRGAAARADQLLDEMEAKYLAGDVDLKPNTFTYNAVINALAKSGEPGAAARAERVLHNMVNRHRHGASKDVRATTINFNSVLDAWAKSGGGRKAAERAEEILEWMDRLYKSGNEDVSPDTITFNAVLDAWARSGDRMAAQRAEQILDHMDDLYRAGNHKVKPDVYTFNTVINAHAKAGSAARAEHVLQVMKQRYHDGDTDFKPNVRTHTSVIDAWAKSGEKGAAKRAEQILNSMIAAYEKDRDPDIKPNVHSANAVCNACAFSKMDEDRPEALRIAFRVFDWLSNQPDMEPDAYTYTILLSVCSNLLPREDRATRFSHAKAFFEKCCQSGYVNDYVLRKLRQTVTEQEYMALVEYGAPGSSDDFPASWSRKVGKRTNLRSNQRSGRGAGVRGRGGRSSSHHRRGDYR
ncbi:PPR: pentatricopeptide repeat domain containing protein [Nitzschia inconspicua]|uniref:PPR: pentatricopeptide repeat domain containing protein n=1 Tax=Nitzschia inconspicua TaxID=303405 RepID=A0A9K3KXM1_9STRA|nr:PPR: pentatricopeptide repeat domain containing protein [Nitzschia inconspicua]